MIKNLSVLSVVAVLGAGCATVQPLSLTADNPASPDAPAAEEPVDAPSLLAGSEPLARWLATNSIDVAHDSHSHHEHNHAPDAKPSARPAGKEHHH